MATDILKQALREEQRLAKLLAMEPLFRQWLAAKAVIDAYSSPNGNVSTPRVAPALAEAQRAVSVNGATMNAATISASAEKPISKAPAIVAAAIAFLKETRHRMNSTQMAPALLARGVDIPGLNKASTLAAYLSAAPQIDNKRGEGYGLREWSRSEGSSGNGAAH